MSIGASIGKRMEHLIRRKGISESELAKALHTNRSTISRIVNDETEKVSSKVLIDAAQYFGVSTDFLLGLTDMPDPMNYSVESFGLTEAAAKAILSKDVHKEMLNRLLENQKFCQLTHAMAYAMEPDLAAGIMSSNNMLAFGESLFSEFMNKSVQKKQGIKQLSQRLASEITNPNTYANERLLDEFRQIIQQIRKEIQIKNPPSVPVTRERLKEMDKELLARAGGERKNINPRMVAEVVTYKTKVADICTPDQCARFIDLLEEILIGYGRTDNETGTVQ